MIQSYTFCPLIYPIFIFLADSCLDCLSTHVLSGLDKILYICNSVHQPVGNETQGPEDNHNGDLLLDVGQNGNNPLAWNKKRF